VALAVGAPYVVVIHGSNGSMFTFGPALPHNVDGYEFVNFWMSVSRLSRPITGSRFRAHQDLGTVMRNEPLIGASLSAAQPHGRKVTSISDRRPSALMQGFPM
jgi:hypothetical protein